MSDFHHTEGKYADYTMRTALEDIDRRLCEIEEMIAASRPIFIPANFKVPPDAIGPGEITRINPEDFARMTQR